MDYADIKDVTGINEDNRDKAGIPGNYGCTVYKQPL